MTPRIRRGGYVFIQWIGDHEPRPVHVYRDDRLVLRWDLEHWRAFEGEAPRRLVRILESLVDEGKL